MRKILFIDDEKDTVKSLINQLETHYNFEINLIQDYRKINKKLICKYDVIILDVMMPLFVQDSYLSNKEKEKTDNGRKTGVIIFEKIRLDFPYLPIIFYTARKDRICCDASTLIVNKPVLAKSIVKTINYLIDRILDHKNNSLNRVY